MTSKCLVLVTLTCETGIFAISILNCYIGVVGKGYTRKQTRNVYLFIKKCPKANLSCPFREMEGFRTVLLNIVFSDIPPGRKMCGHCPVDLLIG